MKYIIILFIFVTPRFSMAITQDCLQKIDFLSKEDGIFFLQNGYFSKEQGFVQKFIDRIERAPYLTFEEQAKHKISIIDGYVYNSLNQKLDTRKNANPFIMDENLDIYILQKEFLPLNQNKRMHHSHLARGENITAAGQIAVQKGVITYIDNQSGHYNPEIPFFGQFIKRLKVLNASLDKTYISIFQQRATTNLPSYEFGVKEIAKLKHQYKLNRIMEILVTPVSKQSESERKYFENVDATLRAEAKKLLNSKEISYHHFQ